MFCLQIMGSKQAVRLPHSSIYRFVREQTPNERWDKCKGKDKEPEKKRKRSGSPFPGAKTSMGNSNYDIKEASSENPGSSSTDSRHAGHRIRDSRHRFIHVRHGHHRLQAAGHGLIIHLFQRHLRDALVHQLSPSALRPMP